VTIGASTFLNFGARGGISQDGSFNFNWSTNGVANAFHLQSATGNVGIGVTNPLYTLHAKAAAGSTTGLRLESSGGTTNFDILASEGDGNAYLYQRSNYGILIGTNNSLRMTITSGGNVGINKATPDSNSRLDVNGQAFVAHLAIYNDNGIPSLGTSPMLYSPASGTLAISTATVERVRINSVGQVGIGTPTPGTYSKLTVTGSINFNNNTDGAISSNEYGQAYSRRTSAVVGGGSATSVKSGLGPEASIMVVCGRSSTGARFADLVLVIGQAGVTPLVVGSRALGSAPTRTYTNGGENLILQLTGSAETFTVFVTGIGGNELT
jgi:hypothetical protein